MLPLHFTRRQIRHAAYITLSAWLFALLSGVVNACLVQPRALDGAFSVRVHDRPEGVTTAAAASTDKQAAPAHHQRGDEHHGPAEDIGKAGCLKFCADEASALAKNKVSHADLPGPVLLDSIHWPSATQLAPVVPWQPVERPASVGPTLFLRLLRLTT